MPIILPSFPHFCFSLAWILPFLGSLEFTYGQASFSLPTFSQQKEVGIFPDKFTYSQVQGGEGHIALAFDYAKPEILNPEDYQLASESSVSYIELVYTKYPLNFSEWRTDHDWLLRQRLESLYAIDSSLFLNPTIRWRLVLQTDCETEPEAQNFFHGLVLHLDYQPDTTALVMADTAPEMKPLIREILFGPLQDSSIYHVLDRHPEWTNKLVVMDWTASMYKNGAATMNWHQKQLDQAAIRHLVLFNDGNKTPHGLKRLGKTGGIYHVEPDNLMDVLELMLKVMRAGLGGDPAENDIEALIRSSKSLNNDFGEIILIPDRNSSIRDIRLLRYLKQPVRIVLFKNAKRKAVGLGASDELVENHYIHPHYLTLASLTKGSIHTIGRDIYELSDMKPSEMIHFGPWHYRKQKDGSFKQIR